jgi:hypothetical protein
MSPDAIETDAWDYHTAETDATGICEIFHKLGFS